MENKIILDTSISATVNTGSGSNGATHGRLNNGGGWCAGTSTNEWISIDFPQLMVITAIALQGHGYPLSNVDQRRTYKYYVQHRPSLTASWTYVNYNTSNKVNYDFFMFIKAVSDAVFDMINDVYHDKP